MPRKCPKGKMFHVVRDVLRIFKFVEKYYAPRAVSGCLLMGVKNVRAGQLYYVRSYSYQNKIKYEPK